MNSETPTPHILLLVCNSKLSWFTYQPENGWKLHRLKGEATLPVKGVKEFNNSIEEIDQRLGHADKLAPFPVHLISDIASSPLLKQLSVILDNHGARNWQVIRLEPLLVQANRHRPCPTENHELDLFASDKIHAWIEEILLPLITERLWGEPAWPLAEPPAPGSTENALHRHLRDLEQRCAWLEANRGDVPLPDGEVLLSFLPALYPHVFTVLSGADLALLIGRVEPFTILSPYPEPSAEVIRKKQREFLNLPIETERKVIRLVSSAAPHLKPRPEIVKHLEHLIEEV
jgi:hypothetical protein